MSSKEDILKKFRANIREKYDMPDLSDIAAVHYPEQDGDNIFPHG